MRRSLAGDGRDHGDEALDHFVEWLGTQDSTLVPPGTAFSYSNSNYAVAGSLLTRVTGKHSSRAFRTSSTIGSIHIRRSSHQLFR
jgi:CubicO group peptidase (beta-lactamase class C family)